MTSFQLAGVEGIKISSSDEILNELNKLASSDDIGLILLSDDMAKEIRFQLSDIRSKRPIPLIFELPAPGSTKESIDYRALLKQILGV